MTRARLYSQSPTCDTAIDASSQRKPRLRRAARIVPDGAFWMLTGIPRSWNDSESSLSRPFSYGIRAQHGSTTDPLRSRTHDRDVPRVVADRDGVLRGRLRGTETLVEPNWFLVATR